MVAVALCVAGWAGAAEGDAKPLNIIAFGAHPDDCELKVGGTAAQWAAQGHRVKFVSVTNGDIGHQDMAGGPLAQRRTKEVQEAAKVLGTEVQVLDNHDGELLPTLEVRKQIIRLIREWNADIVISPRPNDYHPDHRYTAILVQDAAYMVTVPYMCPDTTPLKSNPVFLYMWDHFQKPNPFQADVVVPIDSTMDKKMEAISMMPSQFAEWLPWHDGKLNEVPKDPAGAKQWIKDRWTERFSGLATLYRETLRDKLGADADAIKYIEAFELCEYGRQPSPEELQAMFPTP
jgi:LmbE family N-acetylglucosaminyl deacetylase